MITLLEPATWVDGHTDGVIRDTRQPVPDDGQLSGAIMRMGDEDTGPVVAMFIEGRIFPRKAPVHLHKSDSFRMALGEPIRVGGATYAHGEFRLQQADTFYGPEYWTDEVGTNQLLLMADRRGLKPYLTDNSLQKLADAALADDVSLEGVAMLPRDAAVSHVIANTFGAELRPTHFDAGFTDTAAWPALSDGSRLAVVALGDPRSGVLLLCWDRPAGAPPLPAFRLETDLARLVVEGSVEIAPFPGAAAGDGGEGAASTFGRLGFRLQQEGTWHGASRPGPDGVKELWIIADRRAWPPATSGADPAAQALLAEATARVEALPLEVAA